MRPEYEGRLFIDGEFREAESGNRFEVINEDAERDVASQFGAVMWMSNSSQGCELATRMVVHAPVYDEVLQRLTAIVGALPWGDPADPANVVGPIIRREQLERMEGLVDRAREAGARVQAGGRRGDRGGRGFWYLPTVVADVDGFREYLQAKTIASPAGT